MRYKVNQSGTLANLSDIPVNPSSEEIDNFDNGVMWYEDNDGFLYNYLKINNTNILLNKVYLPYLKFSSDDSFTLSVATPGWIANGDGIIEYSLDKGNTWTTWDGSQLSGDEDNPIYLRGIGNTKITGNSSDYKWSFTGKYILGNIETLLDYQTVASGQHPTMGEGCYANMFYGCTSLVTPPELPATTLASSCYGNMFNGCTSLTAAPELPATTLANSCYSYMFSGCRSLTISSELPATTLADNCYYGIFQGCTSLTTPPQLPATTLASSCYYRMFYSCTSLTAAPELPATTLDDSCYSEMFRNCTSLTTVPELPATTLTNSCYQNMFNGCASLTTVPELPATTLAEGCYRHMFYSCTSLTTLPELPATTLADSCYYRMFYSCTSLKLSTTQDPDVYKYSYRIPTSDTGTTASSALFGMFGSTGGTFTGAPTINTTYYTDHQPV